MRTSSLLLLALLTTFLQLTESSGYCSERHESRVMRINPPELMDPTSSGYSQITVDTKLLVAHVSGQVATNRNGGVVGKTLEEQLEQVFANLKIALDSVGADIEDITRLRGYIVNYNPDTDFEPFISFTKRLGAPAATAFSVPLLAFRELLVEVDLDVVVPESVIEKLRCKN